MAHVVFVVAGSRTRTTDDKACLGQARLRAELSRDDLQPPVHSIEWSETRMRAWFRSGGVELIESDVQIPRSGGGPLDMADCVVVGHDGLAPCLRHGLA